MDPASIAATVEIADRTLSLVEFVRSVVHGDVLSAYFRYDGTRVSGSSKLAVSLIPIEGDPAIWFYKVDSFADYAFVRQPVTPSCAHEMLGTVQGEVQPDARIWRWIAPVLPGRIYIGGHPPNVKIDFMVFGYRPEALLKHFST